MMKICGFNKEEFKEEISSDLITIKVSIQKTSKKQITIEEITSNKKSKLKSALLIICSLIKKLFCLIIEKTITAIISAKVNGLFYQHLILIKSEFFYTRRLHKYGNRAFEKI